MISFTGGNVFADNYSIIRLADRMNRSGLIYRAMGTKHIYCLLLGHGSNVTCAQAFPLTFSPCCSPFPAWWAGLRTGDKCVHSLAVLR